MVRPEGAEGGLALLLHRRFGGYRQDRSSPVSDRHSEETGGSSPVWPQGIVQLHRRQKILTLEWFCKGSLDGAVKSLPSVAGGRYLWLLERDEREGRKPEKLIYKKHTQGTYDYKDKTKCTVAVRAHRVFSGGAEGTCGSILFYPPIARL